MAVSELSSMSVMRVIQSFSRSMTGPFFKSDNSAIKLLISS
eukprot:CAMPEP_0114478328 /NCGR_PEP_ID=MMETSP0104-20121206/15924_1 /TAXON_ID=37642 ORGANISM="Paraphysomonas imperforata, Strain PA2" /NCGR_SAMPLE_ID=MMETSP0104 /ASSEMBLY_ACC=CAM_ASM_000202 /LENGTH=40 /DNA_ID= /DNA_START= /DNA_END= /DNA_ORIENTATION=